MYMYHGHLMTRGLPALHWEVFERQRLLFQYVQWNMNFSSALYIAHHIMAWSSTDTNSPFESHIIYTSTCTILHLIT